MKRKDIVIGLLASGILAVSSFIASSWPDGLEKIAEQKGFIDSSKTLLNSPMPDYLAPFIKNEIIAQGIAGLTGVLVVFLVAILTGKLVESMAK